MIDTLDKLLASTRAIHAAGSPVELGTIVAGIVRELGLIHVTCATVRRLRDTYFHEANFQTWPSNAVREFAAPTLFREDPIVRRSRVEDQPFFWSLDDYDRNLPAHQQIIAIRQRSGVSGGCCVPVPERGAGHSGSRLVLYTSGADFDRCDTLSSVLQLLAAQIMVKLAVFRGSPDRHHSVQTKHFDTTGLLTPRERQILSWIASGKSSWEVSQILAISEHTVNTHIEKSLVKLDATNRTEAVVKALVINDIDLDTR